VSVAGDVQTLRDAEKNARELLRTWTEPAFCRSPRHESSLQAARDVLVLAAELQRLQDDGERWYNRAVQLALSKREMWARLQAAEHALRETRWALVDAAGHVHDCRELLAPATVRTISEASAALAAAAAPSGPEEDE
jgi:hypothetical protein